MDEPDTSTLIELDRRHVLHPYQSFDTFRHDPVLPIRRGSGARLVDTEGREYLDAVGGMWCTNIGLGRDEMADAIAAQVRELAYASPFVDMTTVPAVQLATRLAELAPGDLNHTFFTCGGSTAIDATFRLIQFHHHALGHPERRQILSRVDAYHGTTFASVSIGGKPGDRIPGFDYLDDRVHHLSSPNYYRFGGERTEQEFADDLIRELEDTIDRLGGPDRIAAMFAEPIMGSGGVIVPPADYLERAWRICHEHGILWVSDEVVTAFGRLGEWFASETLFGIQPDVITTAKGLTSGYLPLGAAIVSDRIMEVVAEEGHGRYFAVGYTYSGHPVSCAAGLKNIEIIEREGLLDHVRRIGPYFMERLQELRDLPMVGDVRGSHLMACVELVADRDTKALYPDALDVGKRVANACEPRGLIVRPMVNLNVMSPPLVIDTDDVDHIVRTLRDAIVEVRAELDA
ncbi:MAG: aminotransferase [Ilumatobacteraceae bacterium]|jgi:adenosylmethionine-8-amino-7-oxononanoate aminotransferase|nr:aminotransferase [Ilumatobacteraceae bacterium]